MIINEDFFLIWIKYFSHKFYNFFLYLICIYIYINIWIYVSKTYPLPNVLKILASMHPYGSVSAYRFPRTRFRIPLSSSCNICLNYPNYKNTLSKTKYTQNIHTYYMSNLQSVVTCGCWQHISTIKYFLKNCI